MTDVAYVDIRPVLAKIADLERELVLVGGQAVNFWASFYQRRVPALAQDNARNGAWPWRLEFRYGSDLNRPAGASKVRLARDVASLIP